MSRPAGLGYTLICGSAFRRQLLHADIFEHRKQEVTTGCPSHIPRWMTVTVSRIDGDQFVVQSQYALGVVTVRVTIPRADGDRHLDEAERERIACQAAQQLALKFAEELPPGR